MWQPSASIPNLKKRAQFLTQIRQFFDFRDAWEVDVPILSQATITGVHLHSLSTQYHSSAKDDKTYYLQTSPEFAMKRLIAAGSGAIYYLGKVFRDDPQGRNHNPEFTMLEWYRPNWTYESLMEEVAALLSKLLSVKEVEKLTYTEAFKKYLDINPLTDSIETLRERAKELPGCEQIAQDLTARDDLLDLLITHGIEKQLGKDKLTFIHLYPASQAALAQLSQYDPRVAQRFEVYYRGIELANGFGELADAKEQRVRFEQENQERIEKGLPVMPIDENLLDALAAGFPPCSGVAVGVDRVLMLSLGASSLNEVMPFTAERA
jgi:lysyl-tRNA synthetase class 2